MKDVLVPTGTWGNNEPAAFVTGTVALLCIQVSSPNKGERTDKILYAQICHETDWVHNSRERVSLIRMKLFLLSFQKPSNSYSCRRTLPSIATTGTSPTFPNASSLRCPATLIPKIIDESIVQP